MSIGQDAMDWSPPSCLSPWMRPLITHMMVNGQRTLSSIRSELPHFYIALNRTILKQSKATRVLRMALLSSDQYGAIGPVGFRRRCCRPRVETRRQGATSSSSALIARTASVELTGGAPRTISRLRVHDEPQSIPCSYAAPAG